MSPYNVLAGKIEDDVYYSWLFGQLHSPDYLFSPPSEPSGHKNVAFYNSARQSLDSEAEKMAAGVSAITFVHAFLPIAGESYTYVYTS